MATPTAPSNHDQPRELQVGVIVYHNVTTMDYVGPTTFLEVLGGVRGVPMHFTTISNAQGQVQPGNLVPVYAATHYAKAPTHFDILVIPGSADVSPVIADAEFLAYIRRAADQSTHVLCVCTGSHILGATGLLDGKRATTNKMLYKGVVAACPNVQWVHQARWVVDGKWWTSSGITAGLDMGHAYVAAQYGKETAAVIARTLEIVPTTDPSNDPFAKCFDA